jgi:hypothetical protein
MFYVILEKDLCTDRVTVHSVWDVEAAAVDEMERLIESTEDFAYRMDAVGD